MPLAVQLVSPERILFEGEAEMVVCRPVDGEIAFLAGHVPYLGALRDDPVRILMAGGAETAIAVHGGFVEVSNDHVVVLSDLAELKDQIDIARARRAAESAEAAARVGDDVEAEAAMRRAQARLKAVGELG